MHLRYRGDTPHGVGQRRLYAVLGRGIRLQVQQRRDDLQRIADAVVDLTQKHLAVGRKSRETVTRDVDFRFRFRARTLQLGLTQRAGDGDL